MLCRWYTCDIFCSVCLCPCLFQGEVEIQKIAISLAWGFPSGGKVCLLYLSAPGPFGGPNDIFWGSAGPPINSLNKKER
jgi:hypothetical protein